jgi:hypothetical protein
VVPTLYSLTFVLVALYAMRLLCFGMKAGQALKKYGVKLPAAYDNKDDSRRQPLPAVHQIWTFSGC